MIRIRQKLSLLCGVLLMYTAMQLTCMPAVAAEVADVILTNGRIVTVNAEFAIVSAMAIRDERIEAIGSDADIEKLAGPATRRIDLQGRMVLPGIIDSHVHATGASVYEFDHPIPEMETIADVLKYVQRRAEVLDDGQWILLNQVFVTRLRDQRFPTRWELDEVAPKNPVAFRTGPDAALNSLACSCVESTAIFGSPTDSQADRNRPADRRAQWHHSKRRTVH